jgi:uncharacterized protein YjdB
MAIMAVQLAASAQTLVHRYSFSDTDDGAGNINAAAADSVGGAAWNGVLPNGGTFTGSQLQVLASGSQYVQLPAGILSNYTAVTIDGWVTTGTLPTYCFFFGFGNTDGGGAGEDYIFGSLARQYAAITGGDPGYTYEQGTLGGDNLSGVTVHFTAVYNPPLGYVALYTNGVLQSVNESVTTPLSSVNDVESYICKSLYTGDPYGDMELDEFRIYNGELSPFQVAANDLSGPDVYPAASYGTVTNLQLNIAPSVIAIGASSGAATVTASASGLNNPIVISLPDISIAYSSGNTSVATVNSTNGTVTGVESGTANIIASYSGIFATQAVQVISLPTTMIHRYSFNETTTTDGDVVHDSIGTNNGTFYNASGLSSISNGQLNLNGTVPGDYVDLGSNLVSAANIANNALTFEAWATIAPTNGAYTRIWEFGAFQAGGVIGSSSGANYWSLMPNTANNGGVGRMELSSGGNIDVNTGNFLGQTNVHIVGVFNPNPSRQFIGLYVNGVLVGSASTAGRTISSINDVYSWLGRSLWSGDSALIGSINEFRIYNGELNKFQITASDQAGPDTTNFNVGTFTSFVLNPGTLPVAAGDQRQIQGVMNFSLVTNVVVNGDATLTFTSSNPNVATINNAGNLNAVNLGNTTITGIYGYVSGVTTNYYTNTVAVSVFKDNPATLVHRYSFSDTDDGSGNTGATVADSVGGAAWDGTLPNGGTFTGSQLQLNAVSSQYVTLPSGILSNYTALTIEVWVSTTNDPANSMLYAFGNTDGGGAGENYIFGSLNRDYTAITAVDPGYNAEQGTAGGAALPLNTEIHFTGVYDPTAGYIALYTNGVLQSINTGETDPLNVVSSVEAYIGRSLYTSDPYASLSLDEFRIYNGVLHPDEIEADYLAGPNVLPVPSPLLNAVISGGNLVINWTTNGTSGFTLQSSSTLGSSASWTTAGGAPSVVGTNYQATMPISGSAQFFRLSQ